MDAKTLKALKGSIAKWEAIVAGTGTNDGPSNCPLCRLFNNKSTPLAGRCLGCPVMAATGLKTCDGTPYTEYKKAEDNCCADDELEEFRPLAQAELDFLRSLLPQENK